MNVLEVKGLKKSFKKHSFSQAKKVLNQISFSIQSNTTTGFLGTNGSGKTTTLKCVLGLLPIDEGKVSFFEGSPLSQSVLKRVGFLPEQPYFYDYLTGEELLMFYGRLSTSMKTADLRSRSRSLLKKLDLYFAKDQTIKTYSKGMLQKIGLAQALIHQPDFIILDEPMAGLDPDGRRYVGELIQDMTKREGTAIFFSSHLLHDVERLCHDVVILKEGKVLYQGPIQNLLDDMGVGRREILYLQNAKKQSLYVNSLQKCQQEIDQLRKQGCEILQVHVDQRGLEHIFVQMASKQKL